MRENLSSGLLTKSHTNRSVIPQKMARGLKFHIWEVEGICTIYEAKTKALDQLCLCFHICKKQVFS